jgi:hypothetical protein
MINPVNSCRFHFCLGPAILVAFLTACSAVTALAQYPNNLQLLITNSNQAWTDDQVYVSFETAKSGSSFAGTTASGTAFSLTQVFIGGTAPQSVWYTTGQSLSQLGTGTAGGKITITQAQSARAYISYGSALSFSNGAPTFASGSADPNYPTQWDVVEFTVSNPPSSGDQGDITAINGIGIPMLLTSYTGSPGNYQIAQSGSTTANMQALITSATAYQNANAANNNTGVTPYQTVSGSFVRLMGTNNGRSALSGTSALVSGTAYSDASSGFLPAQVGANALWGEYVDWVGTNSVTTPIESMSIWNGSGARIGYAPVVAAQTGTAADSPFFATYYTATTSAVPWNTGTTISSSWTNATGGISTGTLTSKTTGGTGYALKVTGAFLTGTGATSHQATLSGTSLGTFTMITPPDVVSPTSGTSYILSNTLYGMDPSENYGQIFVWEPATGGTTTYLNAADFAAAVQLSASNAIPFTDSLTIQGNVGETFMQQPFHDVSSGYAFGLVGSNVIDPLSGTSFNAAGSGYWGFWEGLKNSPTAPQLVQSATGGTPVNWVLTSGSLPAGWQIPSVLTATGTTLIGKAPLYAQLTGSGTAHYNQWANVVFNSSETAYGQPYSDYLQNVDVNLMQTGTGSTTVAYVELMLLPVAPIPEPSTVALVAVAGATLGGVEWRRRRRRDARG